MEEYEEDAKVEFDEVTVEGDNEDTIVDKSAASEAELFLE